MTEFTKGTTSKIRIDQELQALIPPLSREERTGLESDIKKDGCRDAIVTWNDTIIDGHNRYDICTRNNIPFQTIDFTSKLQTRDDVIDWMYSNQLNRRNIPVDVQSYLRGKQYEFRKKRAGALPKYLSVSELRQSGVVTQSINTASMVSSEQKVSPRTIERDAEYSRAVDTLVTNTGIGALKDKILHGEVKASRRDIITAAALPDIDKQKRVMGAAVSKETNVKALLNEEVRQQEIRERSHVVIPFVEPTETLDLKNMDCLEYLSTIEDKSIDLVLTDPPYEISRETGFSQMTGGVQRLGVSMEFGQWDNPGSVNLLEVLKEFMRVLKNGGTAIVFYDVWKITNIRDMMLDAGFKQLRIIEWLKTNPVPLNSKINYLTNAREIAIVGIKGSNPKFHSEYDNGVYRHPIYQSRHRFHPTQKPVELMCELIEKHTDDGDMILDTFLGSGTTAVAAIKKKRKCVGCEIDPLMYKKMIGRINDIKK